MSAAIADIINELERLPDSERETAARYIHALTADGKARREAMLRETAGSLKGAEGDALEEAISQCSRVDEANW